jgi:hypothetical protein
MQKPLIQRILERTEIDPETGCWRWPGSHTNSGYGQIDRKLIHRVVYETLVGPIRHEVVDHVYELGCRYKDCHNPDHLEDITQSENRIRSIIARNPNGARALSRR